MKLAQYRKQVEEALALGGHTHSYEEIEHEVRLGNLQAWFDGDTVVITATESTPRKSILHFILTGGSLETLEKMVPAIESWGRSQGCTSATAIGRRGWSKTFLTRSQGWKETQVVLTKGL